MIILPVVRDNLEYIDQKNCKGYKKKELTEARVKLHDLFSVLLD